MKKKPELVWIDDSVDRKKFAVKFADCIRTELTWVYTDKRSVSDILKEISSPALIVIDQFLVDVPVQDCPILGSSLAELVREHYPRVPIVGVTARDKDPKITDYKRQQFDRLFRSDRLLSDECISQIESLISGYSILAEVSLKQVSSFLKRLDPPESEKDRLLSAMPDDLKNAKNYEDPSILFPLSRWILHRLFVAPGFLYDSLWLATYMGIKESALSKVKRTISPALYGGVFADKNERRWWVCEIGRLLHEKVKVSEPCRVSELGRKLRSITESDYSVCYACEGDYPGPPETVAFMDETKNSGRHPMHLRCTAEHSSFQKSLYFDEIRVMKGTE